MNELPEPCPTCGQLRLPAEPVVRVGRVEVQHRTRMARVGDQPFVHLTITEENLLMMLLRNPNRTVAYEWLHTQLPDRQGTQETLRVHMSRLRTKLGGCIRTVRGLGYRWAA